MTLRPKLLTFVMLVCAAVASAQEPVSNDSTQQRRRRGPRFDAQNPDVHDPVMARENGRTYVFSTGFGISVMSSDDMQTWRQERPVFSEAPAWAVEAVPGYRGHTWAPDIQRVGDLWHLYYSCSTFGKNTSAIGLAVNRTLDPSSPDYRWEDRGMVVKSTPRVTDWNAIDPNLIVDEKGTPWLTFGSFWDGIQLVQLDPTDLSRTVGEVRTIARHANPEAVPEEGIDANNNEIEAPFIVRHDGYYYLFVSTGLCCRGLRSTYRTEVGRSKHIEGPYKDRKGKLLLNGAGTLVVGRSDRYAGVGHCGVYEMDGRWWYIGHGYDRERNGASKLVLRPIVWRKGWPEVAEAPGM